MLHKVLVSAPHVSLTMIYLIRGIMGRLCAGDFKSANEVKCARLTEDLQFILKVCDKGYLTYCVWLCVYYEHN